MPVVLEIDRLQQPPLERLHCGVGDSPVGPSLLFWDAVGVRQLSFGGASLAQASPRDDRQAQALLAQIFADAQSVPIVLCGTPFQRRVWRELMATSVGQTVSYAELARRIGLAKGARAVGSALAANEIGFLVPCHRVLRQDGDIGQFRWGVQIKRRLLDWETSQAPTSA